MEVLVRLVIKPFPQERPSASFLPTSMISCILNAQIVMLYIYASQVAQCSFGDLSMP
jgi:hypothetical protein